MIRGDSCDNSFKSFYEYKHQVGGQVPIITDQSGLIAKPSCSQEIEIYKYLKSLKPDYLDLFCAYCGILEIPMDKSTLTQCGASLSRQSSNDPSPTSDNNVTNQNSLNNLVQCDNKSNNISESVIPSYKMRTISKEHDLLSKEKSQTICPPFSSPHISQQTINHNTDSPNDRHETMSIPRSPSLILNMPPTKPILTGIWQKFFDETHKKIETDKFGRCICILLKDITFRFIKPCVLDLKMGVDQLYQNASSSKIESQKKKCKESTSSSLGLRIGGLKVHQTNESKPDGFYLTFDKFWGRTIQPSSLKDSMSTFFNHGNGLRYKIIDRFREKIEDMRAIISSVPIKFMCSSLLLAYDANEIENPIVDVKIIDFSRCEIVKDPNDVNNGFLLGMDNLISLLKLMLKD